ncbi:hypothetical protein BGX26_004218, partial [Mortierella sp. AD094]
MTIYPSNSDQTSYFKNWKGLKHKMHRYLAYQWTWQDSFSGEDALFSVGILFHASDRDLGSHDLSILAEFINKKTLEKHDPKDNSLAGDVTIVGYSEQQPKLAASHRNLTTQQFMKAHVEIGSKQGDQDIPPFYFLAPHVSGPDIVFLSGSTGSDVEKALATVSSHAMQEKIEKEQEKMPKEQKKQQKQRKQDLTASARMVITYPAEVVKFQVVRPEPEPELEGHQRVSIGIDDNNFPKIFPRRHVEFLDK